MRSGANLDGADKAEYSRLSEELSLATLSFSKNVLAATNAYTLNVTDSTQLDGLPAHVVESEIGRASCRERVSDLV